MWETPRSPVYDGTLVVENPAASGRLATVTAMTSSVARTVVGRTPVEIRRSARRKRTVSAYRDGDTVVVLVPARLSAAEEEQWVSRMVARLERSGTRRRPAGDDALARRAAELSARYLGGRARPASVRWVPAMRTRWASCTPADATIRLSRRLQDLPDWVQDYVLLHELAHLIEAGHGPRFWALLESYPRTERARGYLDGVSAAANLDLTVDGDDTGDGTGADTGDEQTD